MVFKLQKFSRRNFLKDLVSLASACSVLGFTDEGRAQKPLGQKYGIRPFRRIEFNIYNYWKDYDCDGKVDSDTENSSNYLSLDSRGTRRGFSEFSVSKISNKPSPLGDGKTQEIFDIGELVGSCKNVFQDDESIYFRLAALGLTHHSALIKLFSPDEKEIFCEPRYIHSPNWAMIIGYNPEKTKKISESHGFGEYTARFYIGGDCIGAKSFELVPTYRDKRNFAE